MDHPCHQCGAAVEDGVPFCPQCNAPQIRVAAVEPASPQPSPVSFAPLSASLPPPHGFPWAQAWSPAALAGIVAAFAMFVPPGAFLAVLLIAGALAVVFFHRHHPAALLTPGLGARLGVLSGGVGFAVFSIFIALQSVFGGGGQLRQALLEALDQAAARSGSDPQTQEIVQRLKSPEGIAFMMALGLVFVLFVFLASTGIGGAVGAALLAKKQRK